MIRKLILITTQSKQLVIVINQSKVRAITVSATQIHCQISKYRSKSLGHCLVLVLQLRESDRYVHVLISNVRELNSDELF